MTELSLLQKVNNAAGSRKFDRFSMESLNWYRKRVQTLNRELAKKELKATNIKKNFTAPVIGRLYCYAYDAKHKDTLPYFDAFPLGFFIKGLDNGWQMLNLHYLSPKNRAIFLDRLIDLATNKKYTARTSLNLSYQLLAGSQKFALFKPCFKRYLTSQLRSRIVEIPIEHWETAVFLPIADFKGASNSKVWSDSARMI